jgi:hypothetical protein
MVTSAESAAPTTTATLTAPGGQVSEVEYGFTKNLGNYQSARLAVRLTVSTSDDPDQVLQQAKAWIDSHLPVTWDEYQERREEYERYARETEAMKLNVESLRKQYAKLRGTLAKLAPSLPEELEDLPF